MNQTLTFPLIRPYEEQTVAVADFFWHCEGKHLRATLPKGWTGKCARVRMIQEITMVNWNPEQPADISKRTERMKRAYTPDPQVHIDDIGQQRGIPNEFKDRDEVKSGIESILVWIMSNKNME